MCKPVVQVLANSLVFVPELAYLRIFILWYTNVLIIIMLFFVECGQLTASQRCPKVAAY